MKLLAIDPSGNFNEGKGTTGWSLLNEDIKVILCGQIRAESFKNEHDYYNEHIILIETLKPDIIVMEDFKLYANKAMNQINSRFETPKLIGIIEFYCKSNNIEIHLQSASEVKKRWTDKLLVYNNFIEQNNLKYFSCGMQISEHIRDSIRHGVHFLSFKYKKGKNNE